MGCSTSGPKVAGKPCKRPPLPRPHEKIEEQVYYEDLTDGVQRISRPTDVNPVLCTGPRAFPIACEKVYLNEDFSTNVHIPIVAAATHGKGRVVCFGSIEYLSMQHLRSFNTGHLMYNCLRWVVNRIQTARPALLLSIPREFLSDCQRYFKKHGVGCEAGSEEADITGYDVVVTRSSIGCDRFAKFVENGGGLIVFCDNEVSSYKTVFGISFVFCHFYIGDPNTNETDVAASFQSVKNVTMEGVLGGYEVELKHERVNQAVLDSLVSTLRFYVLNPEFEATEQFVRAVKASFEYLEDEGYAQDGVLCRTTSQAVVAAFLVHALEKCPVDSVPFMLPIEMFPGKTGNVKQQVIHRNVSIAPQAWFALGVWVPAKQTVKVTINDPREQLWVQVGSHSQNLLVRNGNWKRWPQATSLFPLNRREVMISSWLGGLVYLVTGKISPCEVSITFDSACDAPIMSLTNQLSSQDIPWIDVDVGNAIFTLPTALAQRIREENLKRLSTMVDTISRFTSYFDISHLKRPYRVVFDVDASDPPQCTYPLIASITELEAIIIPEQPTLELFNLLTRLALSSMSVQCMDSPTETAVAQVGACSALASAFPNHDPVTAITATTTPLFTLLWVLHSNRDDTVLPRVITSLQLNNTLSAISGDLWYRFVLELCKTSQRNLVTALSSIKPLDSCIPCSPDWPIDSLHN